MNQILALILPQNADQVNNLVTKGMTALGAILATHGYTAATGAVWQQVTGLVLAVAGYLWSHYYNKPTMPPPGA